MPVSSQLTTRLPETIAELKVLHKEIENHGAEMIRDEAKHDVPYRTGKLYRAIHTDEQPEGVYVVAGDGKAWYGHLVEFGTNHSSPHPFLVPAAEMNRNAINAYAAERLHGL